MKLKSYVVIIIGSALMLTMACNLLESTLPREWVDAFIDTGDPEYSNPGISSESPDEPDIDEPEDAEEVEEGEAVVVFEDSPESNELDLTPEEKLNQGTHHYQINGESTPLLGGDGVVEEERNVGHEFTEDGVYYTFGEMEARFFTKESPNNYSFENENVSITLLYTASGFEHREDGNIFLYYDGTLDE